MKPLKQQNVDPFLKLIGQFGKWQLIILLSILLMKLSTGWVQMSIVFLTPKYTFRCAEFVNSSVIGEVLESTCYDNCVRYEYDTSPMESTIISEWDLICDRHWLASFTQTALQFGLLVGSGVFGFLSDRYGRKTAITAAAVLIIVVGFIVPFSISYEMFTIVRFFLGFALGGINTVSFVFVIESTGPDHREVLSGIFHFPMVLSYASLALVAYYLRTWSQYTLALAFLPLLYMIAVVALTESPRWMVSVGKIDEATKLVERIAEMNHLPSTNIRESITVIAEEVRNVETSKYNYVDLFRRPSLRKLTILSSFVWIVSGLAFYGLNQYVSQTSTNVYVSVTIVAFIQLPSYIAAIFLIKYLGRRNTTVMFSVLGAIFVLILGYVPKTFWIQLTIGCLGVSCSGIISTSIYIHSSELFPTVVRNMGMGLMSISMRIGSMMAPFVSNMSVTVPWLPTWIFGLTLLFSAGICLLLPETRGRKLPDDLKEFETTM